VNDCPLSRFPGGLTTLHLAGDEAIKWLGMQCKRSEEEECAIIFICLWN